MNNQNELLTKADFLEGMHGIGRRIDGIDGRIYRVEDRIDKMEKRMDAKFEEVATKDDLEKAIERLALMIGRGFADIHERMSPKIEVQALTVRVDKIENKLGMNG